MDIEVVRAADLPGLSWLLSAGSVDFVAIHANCAADLSGLGQLPPGLALHGATSCLGAMTDAGVTEGLAAFVIRDPEGAYGSAVADFSAGARAAGQAATRQALARCDRLGERPDLVWVSATPGREEEVLAGIEDVVGADIPVIGGSAADNSVAGDWFVFDQGGRATDAVIVSVLFPSGTVSFAYQNGYAPTRETGTVTRSEGRTVHEIDGRPALEVYEEWTGGAIRGPAPDGASVPILSESTLWPLGRRISQVGSVPFYLLAHPAVAHASGALDLFATVEEGEELTLMTGTRSGLIERAGRVAALARAAGRTEAGPIKGALMIYCGGCMLAVRDEIGSVVEGVTAALSGAPFLGAFTFGEQGTLLGVGNRHGNLMISCVVFR